MTTPAMLSIYNGQQCIGFIIFRGKQGYEAFNYREQSIGVYPTAADAANAISRNFPSHDGLEATHP